MFNTYEEAVSWIHSLLNHGIKPGLERMEWMLERLGHPERRLKFVHVGGTNGKGSTLTYMRHILQESGYEVGTFTSPYIESFTERIALNGTPIPENDLVEVCNRVYPIVQEASNTSLGSPTEFEVITLISFVYFGKIAYPDIVLMEVGLGGRLDSTNVIHPLVSVITNVGFDHMHILGNDLEQITFEKAGIIKSGVPLVTTAENDLVRNMLMETTKENNTKCYKLNEEFRLSNVMSTKDGETFTFHSPYRTIENVSIEMKGLHQVKNASAALMAMEYLRVFYGLHIEEDMIKRGLLNASWPGRFEHMLTNPDVIIDGAHNPEGIASLADTIRKRYPDSTIYTVFSAVGDKDIEAMLKPLYPIVSTITFTTFDFPRAVRASEQYKRCSFSEKAYEENWRTAVDAVMKKADEKDLVLVTGSLYFIAEVRSYLKSLK
ncbi:bifunctional folylpolyglutamate synthase/dihydrofolate synthase [Guptibacillus algicola]|uniref:bifunctional folylpolyglutamate synthase/dihydrofolate synthase n=1 Tax=Guptibacillus algicola TaxID=225844 RepID=UPI001CD62741|nr:folylpolyglutamate synthase/dihydrofolate synthase family protein [Alkalihalobacillus algicola]MCA0986234.1 bifunctional folylpolyglutamate synthase/dihydrofolate synthase [Alkalihalobacillus algicola]